MYELSLACATMLMVPSMSATMMTLMQASEYSISDMHSDSLQACVTSGQSELGLIAAALRLAGGTLESPLRK